MVASSDQVSYVTYYTWMAECVSQPARYVDQYRCINPESAAQTRHHRQTFETNYSEAGNLRHTTHAKDLATLTETPAAGHIRSHESRHRVVPYMCICLFYDGLGGQGRGPPTVPPGERTTRASTASSLKLRRANARRPLTHSLTNPEHFADLMRFRVGSHWLSVVTGRWTDGGTVRAQRYCRKCMAYTFRLSRPLRLPHLKFLFVFV